jgi:quinoprotein glucose dehydrogenase
VWDLILASFALLPALAAQTDWPTYNHDLAGTRYSPLTQINTSNVDKLSRAWSYRLRKDPASEVTQRVGGFSEVTPIVVNGVMYLPAESDVVALEPETGKQIWRYESKNRALSKRGVAYWPGDKNTPPRIVVTASSKLMALNAKTGQLVPGFGNEGVVDMGVPYNSAPTIYKNLLLVGANVQEAPATGPPGNSRAYDARTGAKVWEFHSVPQPGEVGHDTWAGDSWKDRSGTNNWGFSMTVDQERGIAYMTFGSPSSDYYGGDRKGANLFGNSVVAVDAMTGKYKWHFQVVHHDLWDMDLPPAPGLIDVTVKGRKIPILAHTGKIGMMFILDRTTGAPVFGVEERPVPKSDVPGEESWPTQPFPLKPPPFGRNSYKAEDIVTAADTLAEHAKACQELVERSGGVYNAGPYTPYLYHMPGTEPKSTVLFPGAIGGTDWGGTASDPKLGYVFVNSHDEASIGWIEKTPEGSRTFFDRRSVIGALPRFWDKHLDANGQQLGESSWLCQKPPWGRLTAVNANTGDIAWQVTLGVTDELPEGKRNTGRMSQGGPMATAGGLVFIAATNDHRFRAFDSKTGKLLWETRLEYSAHANPITYQGKDGKQYVALLAAGGDMLDNPNPNRNESLVAFALP